MPLVSEVALSQNINTCNNVTDGDDYTAGLYTVKFLPGQTSVTFNVSITDDNVKEDTEVFILTIKGGNSLPVNATRADPFKATVIVVDDDGK